KLDPFAITVNGLSSGGYQCWNTARLYPAMVARAMPMSGISVYETEPARLNIYKFEDISYYQGGKDGAPAPYTAWQVRDAIWNVGGKFRYTEYPNLGHGTWNTVWGEPDFWPQVNGAYAANPHAL